MGVAFKFASKELPCNEQLVSIIQWVHMEANRNSNSKRFRLDAEYRVHPLNATSTWANVHFGNVEFSH